MSFMNLDIAGPMLQTLDHSPTPTPLHTRAGSPNRDPVLSHSHETAKQTVEVLNGLMSGEDTQLEIDARNSLMLQEAELVPVHVIDGSAHVSTASKFYHLTMYLSFNLGLTLFNKAVMIQVCMIIHDLQFNPHFPFSQ